MGLKLWGWWEHAGPTGAGGSGTRPGALCQVWRRTGQETAERKSGAEKAGAAGRTRAGAQVTAVSLEGEGPALQLSLGHGCAAGSAGAWGGVRPRPCSRGTDVLVEAGPWGAGSARRLPRAGDGLPPGGGGPQLGLQGGVLALQEGGRGTRPREARPASGRCSVVRWEG